MGLQQENKESQRITLNVNLIVSIVSAVTTWLISLSKESCSNNLLKGLIILLLFVSSTFFAFYIKLQRKKIGQVFTILGWLFISIFFVILSIRTLTLQCNTDISGQAAQVITSVPQYITDNSKQIIDNSIHIDNSTHINRSSLAQRHLIDEDVKRLKDELPDKEQTVLVQYEKGKQIDTLLARQIYDTLLSLGYLHVRLSDCERMYENLQKGRLTIFPNAKKNERAIVIVNPQQQ